MNGLSTVEANQRLLESTGTLQLLDV